MKLKLLEDGSKTELNRFNFISILCSIKKILHALPINSPFGYARWNFVTPEQKFKPAFLFKLEMWHLLAVISIFHYKNSIFSEKSMLSMKISSIIIKINDHFVRQQ